MEGISQSFTGAVPPAGETRPAWKILRVLGNYFKLDGFTYTASTQVRDEVMSLIGDIRMDNLGKWKLPASLPSANGGLQRVTDMPTNSIDPQVRRAQALQQTVDVADGMIHVNQSLAGKLGLSQGLQAHVEQDTGTMVLPVLIDERLPEDCVLIQSGQACHTSLGAWYGDITVRKA